MLCFEYAGPARHWHEATPDLRFSKSSGQYLRGDFTFLDRYPSLRRIFRRAARGFTPADWLKRASVRLTTGCGQEVPFSNWTPPSVIETAQPVAMQQHYAGLSQRDLSQGLVDVWNRKQLDRRRLIEMNAVRTRVC